MPTTATTGRLESRHISELRWQLMGALAVGWALGACGGAAADESGPLPGSGAVPQPESKPEPEPQPDRVSCDFGDAGEKCYSLEFLDGAAQQNILERTPAYTAEGCLEPRVLQFAMGCAPFPVSSGERRGAECCYQHCNSSPACGRPFVIDGSARVAEPKPSADWVTSNETPPTEPRTPAGAEIGREWLRDALAEHASVAAFSAFSLSLVALGAPAELVRASAAAALDEVFHAKACFELAAHYSGTSAGPAPLDMTNLQIATDLAAVAERAFIDGCIGETAAALGARASLDVCDSPRVARVLARIAEDETNHAKLAWQFVAWALRRGGDAVARVLSSAVERVTADLASTACRASGAAAPEWHRAGRLSEAERAHILASTLREVVRPTLAALLARQQSTSESRIALVAQ